MPAFMATMTVMAATASCNDDGYDDDNDDT